MYYIADLRISQAIKDFDTILNRIRFRKNVINTIKPYLYIFKDLMGNFVYEIEETLNFILKGEFDIKYNKINIMRCNMILTSHIRVAL